MKRLAIKADGLLDMVEYEINDKDLDGTLYKRKASNSFISCLSYLYNVKKSGNLDKYNLTAFSIDTNNDKEFYYANTDIDEKNNVFYIIDPDDGGGKKLLGTLAEVKAGRCNIFVA